MTQVTESAVHYHSNTGGQGILIVYNDHYLFKNYQELHRLIKQSTTKIIQSMYLFSREMFGNQ